MAPDAISVRNSPLREAEWATGGGEQYFSNAPVVEKPQREFGHFSFLEVAHRGLKQEPFLIVGIMGVCGGGGCEIREEAVAREGNKEHEKRALLH